MNRPRGLAVFAAVAVSLAVGFLAGRLSAPDTPPRSTSRERAATDKAATDAAAAEPAPPDTADDPAQAPAASSGRRRTSGPSELSVTAILAELRHARQNRRRRLLRLLGLMDGPAALDALLQELSRDEIPIKGLGAVWNEVLGRFDDPRIGPAVRDLLDRRMAAGYFDSPSDLRSLWELALSKLGTEADAAILSRLTDASLTPNSTFRLTVLDAIGAGAGPEVRSTVAQHLEDPNSAVSAFRALLRMGDDVSRDLALQHLLNLGHHAIVASQYLGPYLTDHSAEVLRHASASDQRHVAVYLVALSGSTKDRIQRETPFIREAIVRVLREDAGDAAWVVRRFSAEALLRMVDSIADPELARLAREQAKTSKVGRENLLMAARRMEEVLASR